MIDYTKINKSIEEEIDKRVEYLYDRDIENSIKESLKSCEVYFMANEDLEIQTQDDFQVAIYNNDLNIITGHKKAVDIILQDMQGYVGDLEDINAFEKLWLKLHNQVIEKLEDAKKVSK